MDNHSPDPYASDSEEEQGGADQVARDTTFEEEQSGADQAVSDTKFEKEQDGTESGIHSSDY